MRFQNHYTKTQIDPPYLESKISDWSTMTKRKIAVVTGSRAEYGILKPLLHLILERDDLELSLMVTGLHLLEKFGNTISAIKDDKFKIDSIVEMYDESEESKLYLGLALGRSIDGFTNELARIEPDILVVLGDRLEPLAATLAAAFLRIPIAHIHGGDNVEGGLIDESIRHSITRFSNIHFPAIDEHGERLIKMGEDPSRIHVVGSMGLDTIVKSDTPTKKEIANRIGFDIDDKSMILIFHPEKAGTDIRFQICEIIEAMKELKLKTLILYPNNDAGSEIIIEEIEKLGDLNFVHIIPSLPHSDYIDVLKHMAVMVGNSSSGIIEAASIKLPVVNIGSRQKLRDRSMNIINVPADRIQICQAIQKAVNDETFRRQLQDLKNPYGDGNSAERIVEVLRTVKIDDTLLWKNLAY